MANDEEREGTHMTDTLATIVAEMRVARFPGFKEIADWADRIDALQAGEAVAWAICNSRGEKVAVTCDDPRKLPADTWDWIPVSHSFQPLFTHPAACMAHAQGDSGQEGLVAAGKACADHLKQVADVLEKEGDGHFAGTVAILRNIHAAYAAASAPVGREG